MRIEYERACVEAGMSEEKIKEIRKIFDADYKRLKRQNEAMKREGLDFLSLELLMDPAGDATAYNFIDPEADVEEEVMHRLDLEHLREVLSRISVKDREFIMDCFNTELGARQTIVEKYGMTLGAIKQKKHKIILKIRKLFFEEA